jgi:hypothetical protein
MRLPGYLVAFILTLLLAGTTPVGTGAGVHQFDLLHPVFGHVHMINGRVVTHEQLAIEMAAPTAPLPGVAFGSGGGAGSDEGGIGVSPTLPNPLPFVTRPAATESSLADIRTPAGRRDAPPDPPPLGYC